MFKWTWPIVFVCLWIALVSPVTTAGKGSEKPFVSIFNDRDLSGWEGEPGWWYVEDGAITAESTSDKPCKKQTYLIWRGAKPGDFELRAEYRLSGGNSGIQFRSREVPPWDTNGYQADLDAAGEWTGALFEHTRRGIALRGEPRRGRSGRKASRHQDRRSCHAPAKGQVKRLE